VSIDGFRIHKHVFWGNQEKVMPSPVAKLTQVARWSTPSPKVVPYDTSLRLHDALCCDIAFNALCQHNFGVPLGHTAHYTLVTSRSTLGHGKSRVARLGSIRAAS
jgi:hypothetical protein